MRNDTPRQIVRSRTTMSYAFEAAVLGVVEEVRTAPVSAARTDLAVCIAEAVRKGTRKTPTWTVSKKDRRR